MPVLTDRDQKDMEQMLEAFGDPEENEKRKGFMAYLEKLAATPPPTKVITKAGNWYSKKGKQRAGRAYRHARR